MSTRAKYDALAEGFSEREYADPAGYAARRAQVIVGLGPRLARGASLGPSSRITRARRAE